MDYTSDYKYPEMSCGEPEGTPARQRNHEMNRAWQLIACTNISVFLTGKAGTGKTTFLRRLRELSPKRMVVLAPTGVAAINAQGQTIHSFFQLPFGPIVPGSNIKQGRAFQMRKEKKELIRTLDLLVIDEISMVRCDLLDAIDTELRKYRNRYLPFGGVQLLLIGDLSQLAPVAKESEWALLSPHYSTPYFFGSKALQQIQLATVELQHIYRQQDREFIDILARVRDNKLDEASIATLNRQCHKAFIPPADQDWIRLTTHNRMADNYNQSCLNALPGDEHQFAAIVKKNFPESSYPADPLLVLKKGAQVMFIKNDPNPEHAYYNGKIGVITNIGENCIEVYSKEDKSHIKVGKVVWENTKYTLNEESKEIEEQVEGTFEQYPLRLAWAITVHKSQGLTFDHAILDINESFAHGQTYVAMSRCRTLQGMILTQPFSQHAVITDHTVNDFVNGAKQSSAQLDRVLPQKMLEYYIALLDELFSFDTLTGDLRYLHRVTDEHLYKKHSEYLQLLKNAMPRARAELADVSIKFATQYRATIQQGTTPPAKNEALQERLTKSFKYFADKMVEILASIVKNCRLQIDNKRVAEQYNNALDAFLMSYRTKLLTFTKLEQDGFSITNYLSAKATSSINLDDSPKTKKKPKPYAAPKNSDSTASEPPAMAYEPWTEEDDDLLREMLANKVKYPEMMQRLGRTRGAIKARIKRLTHAQTPE